MLALFGPAFLLLDRCRPLADYNEKPIIYGLLDARASMGFSPGENEFSLIDGGYGVFSSRMTARQVVKLGGETVPELVAMPYWGFKFIGGRE